MDVRDHGPGISPEERETIWTRFQRARSAVRASGLGLGVGLYIARMLVKQREDRWAWRVPWAKVQHSGSRFHWCESWA